MKRLPMLAFAAVALMAAPLAASQPGEDKTPPSAAHVVAPINLAPGRDRAMTYELFEATVGHADLADCPKALAQDGRFCRLVLNDGALHVFAFAEGGDQPMQAVLTIPVDEIRFPD